MSQFNHRDRYSNNIPTALFADCLANSKEIFELIDSVFPIDSCRHYELLPLSLDGNNLSLGMLNPSDEESLKFVNSIAKVFKYNLHLKLIDEQTLQIILESYPQSSPPNRQNRRDREQTIIDATVIDSQFEPNQPSRSPIADSAPTIISKPDEQLSNQKPELASDLEGLPPDLDFLRDLDLSPKQNTQSTDPDATLYEIPPEFLHQQATNSLDSKVTVIAEDTTQLLAQEAALDEVELAFEEAQISQLIAEASQNNLKQELETDDFLTKLGLQLSWQKLLEQAFKHGSEEICLTRYSNFGNIVANKEELPQSYAEQIPLPIFCSVVDEIKRMARIPLDMSNHPKKVVLERFYDQERILLRLEFTDRSDRETVVVQILRGDNLKTYEQQQMDKMSEQALHLAKQLEKTLRRIQACFDSAEVTNIKELQTIQSRINHQLRLLDR